jgi:hypothetical protein
MRSHRLLIPLTLSLASLTFVTVGGACLPSSPPSPTLNSGSYVLIAGGTQLPPQVTFTDATGRRIRVIADTLQLTTSTRGYIERGSIAITPPGGTEQAPTAIALGPQTYTVTGSSTFEMPVTIAGFAQGTILANTALDLRMSDGSHWNFQIR